MTEKMSLLKYDKVRTMVLCAALLMLLFSLVPSNILIILFLVLTLWKYQDPKIYLQQNTLGWFFHFDLFFMLFQRYGRKTCTVMFSFLNEIYPGLYFRFYCLIN